MVNWPLPRDPAIVQSTWHWLQSLLHACLNRLAGSFKGWLGFWKQPKPFGLKYCVSGNWSNLGVLFWGWSVVVFHCLLTVSENRSPKQGDCPVNHKKQPRIIPRSFSKEVADSSWHDLRPQCRRSCSRLSASFKHKEWNPGCSTPWLYPADPGVCFSLQLTAVTSCLWGRVLFWPTFTPWLSSHCICHLQPHWIQRKSGINQIAREVNRFKLHHRWSHLSVPDIHQQLVELVTWLRTTAQSGSCPLFW